MRKLYAIIIAVISGAMTWSSAQTQASDPPTSDPSDSAVPLPPVVVTGSNVLREDLMMLVFARGANDAEGELVGGTGLHRIDWTVRKFEIGYWRKTGCEGRGFMTEAVRAMARMAFDALGARRVEIRMDDRNVASWRLAERAGFTLEALLRFDSLTPAGEPRSTRIYARVRGAEEPMA